MKLDYNELAERIASKKESAAWHFEGERDAPLTAESISAIEKKHGIVLPLAYREFLIDHGAGEFAFGHVYSPAETSGWSLWKEFAFMPEKSGCLIPFSDNGGGDYYCFRVVAGRCEETVVWADHEQGYAITDSEYEDFRDFVARVCLRGEE
ncbi:MAG TPA: SMI1/KNR4 family protein [Opitutaceae bacterium]|nr:SMI1/KNR4 family protein [Opitutaceae bacterium]